MGMRKLLLILFVFIGGIAFGQTPLHTLIAKKASSAPPSTQRILIDIGGDGVADDADGAGGAAGITDTGVKTPNNSAGSTGQAGDGLWWNNLVDARGGTWISNPVNTLNSTVTGFSISASQKPSLNINSANDYSINFGGTASAVGDYPATAVQDNVYYHLNAGTTDLTFVIPSGYAADVKFWGNRASTGPRVMEFKLSTDGAYTLSYESANNTTYATAVSFTGLTGTVIINSRVKSGSTFGHISVIDVTLTPL